MFKYNFFSVILRIVDLYLYLSVLHPEEWLRKILKFLDLPWNDNVLKHHEQINKKGKKCYFNTLNMFYGAGAFNQSLCDWFIFFSSNMPYLGNMFYGSGCPIKFNPSLDLKGHFCQKCIFLEEKSGKIPSCIPYFSFYFI